MLAALLFVIPVLAVRSAVTISSENSSEEINYDKRIVGGWDASILSYPYQIALLYLDSLTCGGSIIGQRTVITAAHCVNGASAKDFSIRAGSSHHARGGIKILVERIIDHERFNASTLNNDVAILVLASRLIYSPIIRPIQLTSVDDVIPSNALLIVSGWGAISESGSISPSLKYTIVGLISRESCAKSYEGTALVTNEMFCAGMAQGGRDSCQGDSGGPIVIVGNSSGIVRLAGLVSFGIGCAQPGYPGVYAKISALRAWIDKKLPQI